MKNMVDEKDRHFTWCRRVRRLWDMMHISKKHYAILRAKHFAMASKFYSED